MSEAAREEQSEAREEQSESGQSLEVSQFFTRNKSFKIILGEITAHKSNSVWHLKARNYLF